VVFFLFLGFLGVGWCWGYVVVVGGGGVVCVMGFFCLVFLVGGVGVLGGGGVCFCLGGAWEGGVGVWGLFVEGGGGGRGDVFCGVLGVVWVCGLGCLVGGGVVVVGVWVCGCLGWWVVGGTRGAGGWGWAVGGGGGVGGGGAGGVGGWWWVGGGVGGCGGGVGGGLVGWGVGRGEGGGACARRSTEVFARAFKRHDLEDRARHVAVGVAVVAAEPAGRGRCPTQIMFMRANRLGILADVSHFTGNGRRRTTPAHQ